jgi:hypothetical protein
MYNILNNKKGKTIKEISFDEKDHLFKIILGEEIFTIDTSGCRCCFTAKIENYINYDLDDLKEQIFIEFADCEKPENVIFKNEDFDDEDSENTSYRYYYIEYKYPDSKEHFYYCFCLACESVEESPMHWFEGLSITNYTELLAKEAKKKKDREIELKLQKDLLCAKSTDTI